MQKNDDLEKRMKLREIYGNNELYCLVGQICNKYAGARSTLRLMPLDLFEIIVGWLDMISAHLKDEELEFKIQGAWTDIRERIMNLTGGCHGNEDYVLDEMTVTTLCLINLCLRKLIDDEVPGSRLYYRYTLKIAFLLDDCYPQWEELDLGITNHEYYQYHKDKLKNWVISYMTSGSMASFTDDLGRLKTNVSANGREKANAKIVLFASRRDNKKPDLAVTTYWKEAFLAFLEERKLNEKKLDSSKSNKVVRMLVAFSKYWKEDLKMELSDSGAPYYRFLVDDCHIECKVKAERTMVTHLGNMLKSEVETDEECLVKSFMRRYQQEHPQPDYIR